MDLSQYQNLVPEAGVVITLGTAWLTVRKIARDFERSKKEQAAEILQSAKEADAAMKLKLEGKIHDLESQVKNFKENVEKDLNHLRETYNGELKFLGQKIEELRSEVRNQHSQLVQLLTKMIENRD